MSNPLESIKKWAERFMDKKVIGVDIGHESLKLVLCMEGEIKQSAVVLMPDNMIKKGHVVSPEAMAELIRNTMKKNQMRASRAALVISDEVSYLKTVNMPRMDAKQLRFNLPYEFTDYLSDELRNYIFDYAMISKPEDFEDDENGEMKMELLVAAMPETILDEFRDMLRKAGLRLVKSAPAICSYLPLIERLEANRFGTGEYCILDLGYMAVRMHMFNGMRYMGSKELDFGLSALDQIISEEMTVDIHLAHTYLTQNYEGCQLFERCVNLYDNVALELIRSLNFYRFSNQGSKLNDIYFCGGGIQIVPLVEIIAGSLDAQTHTAGELLQIDDTENTGQIVSAAGITIGLE